VSESVMKLYRFHWDCGRQGWLEGIIAADPVEVQAAMNKEIYFGEVLGKHSEIYGPLGEEDIHAVEASEDQIDWLVRVFASNRHGYSQSSSITICGYNPLHHVKEEDEDEE